MLIRLHAYTKRNQFMFRRACFGLASINQIRPWTTNGVFDDVGQEGRSNQGDRKPQKADMEFVCGWACDEGPEQEDEQGEDGGVND